MNNREKLCAWMFEVTKKPYAFLFKRKKKAWGLSEKDLLAFTEGSLGFEVGLFLNRHQIQLIDKLESHDVYHVITGMGTTVKDEVGMQFLLMGNGKRSFYLFSTVLICLFLLPEHWRYFYLCYKRGKKYERIHELDLKSELFNQLTWIKWKLVMHKKASNIRLYTLLNDHKLN